MVDYRKEYLQFVTDQRNTSNFKESFADAANKEKKIKIKEKFKKLQKKIIY